MSAIRTDKFRATLTVGDYSSPVELIQFSEEPEFIEQTTFTSTGKNISRSGMTKQTAVVRAEATATMMGAMRLLQNEAGRLRIESETEAIESGVLSTESQIVAHEQMPITMSLVFTENASWHRKDLRERTRDLRDGIL